jgi:geranylgeranyl diphosphate synthase type I
MATEAQGHAMDPQGFRERIDGVLFAFVATRRADAVEVDPRAAEPLDEIVRLLEAGGKRIRPAFCYWGYRAAGGTEGDAIWRAAAALELLHTMALVHDDVMDLEMERRGAPSLHVRGSHAAASRGHAAPQRHGEAVAILVGDLAAVLADHLLLEAGFPPERLAPALERYHRMREVTAAGQYLDLVGADVDAGRVASAKGGAYSVEGPLLIGAALAGGSPTAEAALLAYGRPLGEAFQLHDDLVDDDASHGLGRAEIADLIERAHGALRTSAIEPEAAAALAALADLVGAA